MERTLCTLVVSTVFINPFWVFLSQFESLPIQFSLTMSHDGTFIGKGWSREKSRRKCFDVRKWNGRIELVLIFNDGCRKEEIQDTYLLFLLFASLARNYLKTNKDMLSWYEFCSCLFEFAILLLDLTMFAHKSKSKKVKIKVESDLYRKCCRNEISCFILWVIFTFLDLSFSVFKI